MPRSPLVGASKAQQVRLSRDISHLQRLLTNPLTPHQPQLRRRASEERLAVPEHDGMQKDVLRVDQTKLGEARRKLGSAHFDLAVALGLQFADRSFEILADQRRVRPNLLQRL